MHRLITIRFSHYNEKARWAFDRFRVPYKEECYLPGFHAVGALRIAPKHGFGKADRVSSPLSTPILVTDDGRCLRDSSAIVRYVSDRYASAQDALYPDAEVSALEERFSNELGPHTRRYAYWAAFSRPELVKALAEANVGNIQARLFKGAYPFLRRWIVSSLGVTPERAARSLEKARAVFDEVSTRIADRRYLVADRFTAADIAFACMAAPLLGPSPSEGFGGVLPALADLPAEFTKVAHAVRATPAGAYALRLFREERGVRQVPLAF